MLVFDAIKTKLEKEFLPGKVEITNESYKHQGHAGYGAGGESHFGLAIISNKFNGKTRLERTRMVYKILDEEIKGPIHAITFLKAQTPEEAIAASQ